MRRLYLVRHGAPAFPGGEKLCLGTTDLPLSTLGRLQACMTAAMLRETSYTAVYSSPLCRAIETARLFCPEPIIVPNLIEGYAGEWEGLSFGEIKERYPELYRRRGENQNLPIPGAEPIEHCAERFASAVASILRESVGDIVIVAHVTVVQSYICKLAGLPLTRCRELTLPHGSYTAVEFGEETGLRVVGAVPNLPLTPELCEELMYAADVPERTVAHCRRVAEKAGEIADALNKEGYAVNRERITKAALLHDIARAERDHGRVGGQWLCDLGYRELYELVAVHHELLPVEINEAAVLSIADRCISGSEELSIDERFARSEIKCTDAAARAAHRARYENAKALKALINRACGETIIK